MARQGQGNTVRLTDKASSTIDKIVNRMNKLIQSSQRVDQSMKTVERSTSNAFTGTSKNIDQMTKSLQNATRASRALGASGAGISFGGFIGPQLERMSAHIESANQRSSRLSQITGTIKSKYDQVVDNIKQAAAEQNRFNGNLERGSFNAGNLLAKVMAIVGSLAGVRRMMDLSDTQSNTLARLNLINDGLMTTQQLQEGIFQAAERSRGSYQDMADLVGKLGLNAREAFGSNAELVHFAEILTKQYAIAGSTAQEASAATHQLIQALGSGVLRGEELNSVMEQAPMLIQAIADYLEVPKGQIRELASEGQITADIVKNAMFASADDINAKFAEMPRTFASVGQSIRNHFIQAFAPIGQLMNDWLNSEQTLAMINSLIGAMYTLGNVATTVLQGIGSLVSWIADRWQILGPMVYGLATAFLYLRGVQLAYNAVLAIGQGVVSAYAFAERVRLAAVWMASDATFSATSAQWGFNAALMATPIGWVVTGIIAIIAVLYAAVGAWNYFTGSSVSLMGVVAGAIMALWQIIQNVFIFIANLAISVAQIIVNAFVVLKFAIESVFYAIALVAGIVYATLLTITQIVINGIGQLFTSLGNAISTIWFNIMTWVLEMLATILDGVSSFVNFVVDGFSEIQYNAQNAWYNIAKGAGSMAQAIASGIDGMVNSIISSVETMINAVLSGINSMISELNKVPGVNVGAISNVELGRSNLSGGVGSFVDGLSAPTRPSASNINLGDGIRSLNANRTAPTAKTWNDIDLTSNIGDQLSGLTAPTMGSFWTPGQLDYKSVSGGYNQGYNWGSGLGNQVEDFFKGNNDMASNISDISNMLGDIPGVSDAPGGGAGGGRSNPSGGRLDSIGQIEEEVKVDEEYVRLVRDVAKQRWQQNYITLTPEVTNNIGEIRTDQEYEDFIAKFNQDVADAIYNDVDGIT